MVVGQGIFIKLCEYLLHIIASKNITLKVDEKVYDLYKEYCKKKGLVMS
jgi:hypothetical protein